MGRRLTFPGGRVAFALCVFVVLAAAIWTRTPKWLGDFDQSFYLTIAYDMERHGVFSNGVFDDVDSTVAKPPPGTFFAPIYPALLYAVGKIDQRFGRATACVVEYNYKRRSGERMRGLCPADPSHARAVPDARRAGDRARCRTDPAGRTRASTARAVWRHWRW